MSGNDDEVDSIMDLETGGGGEENPTEEDEDKSEIFNNYLKIMEDEKKQEEEEEAKLSKKNLEIHEEIAVDYFEDNESTMIPNAHESNINEETGEISGNKKSVPLKERIKGVNCLELFRRIPLPLIHPSFHQIASRTGLGLLMYINVVDFYVNIILFPLNFFVYSMYMVLCFTNPNYTAWIYQFIQWGAALIYIPLVLGITILRYYLCLQAGLQNKQRRQLRSIKKLKTYWIVYIVITICYDIFLVCCGIGFLGTLGLVKSIIIGIGMGANFWSWGFFIFSLASILIWLIVVIISIVIIVVGVVELYNLIKGKSGVGGGDVNVEIEEDGGNVVFFGNMAFVFN